MAWVYILTLATGKYYIGSTTNIEQRIQEHQSGKSLYTKNKDPKLLFQKEYNGYSEARKIEIKLKKAKSRIIIEQFIAGAVR